MRTPTVQLTEAMRRCVWNEEIRDLISRFAQSQDEPDFDALERLFAPDATFDIQPEPAVMAVPLRGRATIRQALEARTSVHHETAQRRHHMTNVVIDHVDQATAIARTFMMVVLVPKGGEAMSVCGSGVYHDRFARGDGRWVFAERVLRLDV